MGPRWLGGLPLLVMFVWDRGAEDVRFTFCGLDLCRTTVGRRSGLPLVV